MSQWSQDPNEGWKCWQLPPLNTITAVLLSLPESVLRARGARTNSLAPESLLLPPEDWKLPLWVFSGDFWPSRVILRAGEAVCDLPGPQNIMQTWLELNLTHGGVSGKSALQSMQWWHYRSLPYTKQEAHLFKLTSDPSVPVTMVASSAPGRCHGSPNTLLCHRALCNLVLTSMWSAIEAVSDFVAAVATKQSFKKVFCFKKVKFPPCQFWHQQLLLSDNVSHISSLEQRLLLNNGTNHFYKTLRGLLEARPGWDHVMRVGFGGSLIQ